MAGNETHLLRVRFPERLNGGIIRQITGMETDLLAGNAAFSIVDGIFKQLGEVDGPILTAEVALARNLNFLAAKHAVITRVLNRRTVSAQSVYNVSIADNGRVGHALRPHLHSQCHQIFGRVLVEADGETQKQVSQFVRRISAVLRMHAAEGDVMDAVLKELKPKRGYNILCARPAFLFDSADIEWVEILVYTADTVHPVPKAVEIHELCSFV